MDEEHSDSGEEHRSKKISRRLSIWLGVAASTAGVVAGVVLVIDRWGPKPVFTLADWAKQANAFCSDNFGKAEAMGRKGTASLNAVRDAPDSLPSDQFQSRLDTAAADIAEGAGIPRELKSDYDSIQRPQDYEAKVDQLIEKLNKLSQEDVTFSRNLAYYTARDEATETVNEFIQKRMKLVNDIGELQTQLGVTC